MLSHSTLTDRIVQQFDLAHTHAASTPMQPGLKLPLTEAPTTDDGRARMTKNAISLVSIAVDTRSGIAVAVYTPPRFLDCYHTIHTGAAKRVVRYL